MTGRARELTSIAAEQDTDVELVTVLFEVLEEPCDARELLISVVHPFASLRRQLAVRASDIDLMSLRGFQQLPLKPPPRRVPPRLHGPIGQTSRIVGNHKRLVVAEDVAEPFAFRTGAERMVEREEKGFRLRERQVAGMASVVKAIRRGLTIHEFNDAAPLAFAQRDFERFGDPPALSRIELDAIQNHEKPRPVVQLHRRSGIEIVDLGSDFDPREPSPDQP